MLQSRLLQSKHSYRNALVKQGAKFNIQPEEEKGSKTYPFASRYTTEFVAFPGTMPQLISVVHNSLGAAMVRYGYPVEYDFLERLEELTWSALTKPIVEVAGERAKPTLNMSLTELLAITTQQSVLARMSFTHTNMHPELFGSIRVDQEGGHTIVIDDFRAFKGMLQPYKGVGHKLCPFSV